MDGFEILRKIRSENTKNAWKNPEIAAKIKEGMKRSFHEARMKMTPEERKKSFGSHNIGNLPPNAKAIYQLDKDTLEIINEYASSGRAAIALGLNRGDSSNIRRAANENTRTAYGYKWRWKDE